MTSRENQEMICLQARSKAYNWGGGGPQQNIYSAKHQRCTFIISRFMEIVIKHPTTNFSFSF